VPFLGIERKKGDRVAKYSGIFKVEAFDEVLAA